MKNLYASLIVILALVMFSPVSALADVWGEPIPPFTPPPLGPRFVVPLSFNGEAVLDQETGLFWEQSPDTGQRNWSNAHIFCNQRIKGGRKGWRLPTIQELESLVDPTQANPALPADHPFSNVQVASDYFSATTNVNNNDFAWFVFLGSGGNFPGGFKNSPTFFTWCVRGGQGVNPQ